MTLDNSRISNCFCLLTGCLWCCCRIFHLIRFSSLILSFKQNTANFVFQNSFQSQFFIFDFLFTNVWKRKKEKAKLNERFSLASLYVKFTSSSNLSTNYQPFFKFYNKTSLSVWVESSDRQSEVTTYRLSWRIS